MSSTEFIPHTEFGYLLKTAGYDYFIHHKGSDIFEVKPYTIGAWVCTKQEGDAQLQLAREGDKELFELVEAKPYFDQIPTEEKQQRIRELIRDIGAMTFAIGQPGAHTHTQRLRGEYSALTGKL